MENQLIMKRSDAIFFSVLIILAITALFPVNTNALCLFAVATLGVIGILKNFGGIKIAAWFDYPLSLRSISKEEMDMKRFAIYQHDIVCNQKYNKNLPYSTHLGMVADVGNKFRSLLTSTEFAFAIQGCWGHDLIEDARLTYNDIKDKFGVVVADIIFRCTEEKGKTRLERHPDNFYIELASHDLSLYTKLCDQIANVSFGVSQKSGMVDKYRKEYPRFKQLTYNPRFDDMYKTLESLLDIKTT